MDQNLAVVSNSVLSGVCSSGVVAGVQDSGSGSSVAEASPLSSPRHSQMVTSTYAIKRGPSGYGMILKPFVCTSDRLMTTEYTTSLRYIMLLYMCSFHTVLESAT